MAMTFGRWRSPCTLSTEDSLVTGRAGDIDHPAFSVQPVTHPYHRWLGAAPSSRYAIFIRLR